MNLESRLTVTNHARLSALHTVICEVVPFDFKALVAFGPYTRSAVPTGSPSCGAEAGKY